MSRNFDWDWIRHDLRAEYRAMALELRNRGTEPTSTLEEYVARRVSEIERWNYVKAREPDRAAPPPEGSDATPSTTNGVDRE